MKDQKSYSLSHLLDEMITRQDKSSVTRGAQEQSVSITSGLAVIRALKDADDAALPLITLARVAGMKIGPCQEAVDLLKIEGLVNIETDDTAGNDIVKLSQKGKGLS